MLERRTFTLEEVRISADTGSSPIISGHAAVFNKPSEEIFGIRGAREVVRPGAFAKTIKIRDVRALVNHDDNLILGRISNGTLSLEEDAVGLKVRILPPETSYAKDWLHLIRNKYITQMSFGFRVPEGGDKITRDGQNITRELLEVELFDVSPVTQPAYPQTDVQARSYFEARIKAIVSVDAAENVIVTENADELEKSVFAERMKARQQFIASRTPPPDPLSYTEIIKNARIKATTI